MQLNFKLNKLSDNTHKMREENLSIFRKEGFPNRKLESWKFTDLERILNENFDELENGNLSYKISNSKRLNFEHNSIVLVNGSYISDNFELEPLLQKNISIKKLNLENHLSMLENSETSSMQNLNTALYDSGLSIEIDKNSEFEKPIVIFNYFSDKLQNKIINNSNFIKLSENSKATIIELLIDQSGDSFLVNSFKYCTLQNNSKLNYYFINEKRSNGFYYNYFDSKLFKDCELKKYIFSSGLKFYKSDENIDLIGQNSDGQFYSGTFLKEKTHQEIKTFIKHTKENCRSHQSIKNVLTSDSIGVFQGKIYVDKIAQKTNAYQISRGLLLDEGSTFSAKPELEIYADDVKCSHGSTSGNIDENMLFYLRTRGISKKDAIKIIIKAFLESIIINIADANVRSLVNNHLKENINYEN